MWSMPRSALRVVAVILGLCAVGGFIMGVRSAPDRARLPGEGAAGPALEASDARPLEDLVLTPSELKAEPEPEPEEKKPEEVVEVEPPPITTPLPPIEKAPPPAKTPTLPSSDEDRVGDLIDGLTPPPEQPPY
jgi:hypothetical protein